MPLRSDEPTVSGGVFMGIRDWVYKVHGPAGHALVRDRLPLVDRVPFDNGSIVNTSRVDARAFKAMGDAMIECFGLEGEKGYLVAAEHVAMSDLSSYMRILMKLGSPAFVVQRFPRVWKHYFSSGTLTVLRCESGDAEIEIEKGEPYGDGALLGAVGWMRAALAYSGGKSVTVQHRRERDDLRRYHLTWS